jgi:hypothetical protein
LESILEGGGEILLKNKREARNSKSETIPKYKFQKTNKFGRRYRRFERINADKNRFHASDQVGGDIPSQELENPKHEIRNPKEIQKNKNLKIQNQNKNWIPACAGMTGEVDRCAITMTADSSPRLREG